MFTDVIIDLVCIRDAFVKIGSSLSMFSILIYTRPSRQPSIQSFSHFASDIVKMCGASVKVISYVDIFLKLVRIVVLNLFLVVSNLPYPII